MYSAHPVVHGFPGKTESHGSFGWSSVHVLIGQDRVIMVETGPPSYIPLLSATLAEFDLNPPDVTDILITHAHWDHLSNIAMFPRAQVWIGAGELDWAAGLPGDAPFISQPHVRELRRQDAAVHEVSDNDRFLPGVTAVATPGHTPGHMAYVAHCATGPIVFAGDAVKNLRELTTLTADSTLDQESSTASMRRIRTYMAATGALLVPGHDVPLRLERDEAVRIAPQRARISFFADAHLGPREQTISDDPPPGEHPASTADPPSSARHPN